MAMPGDFYTFDEVLRVLQIDEDELKRLISQGELRGIRDGAQIKFRKADVDRLRTMRESEPTIILTDSDAELAVPSEDKLVIEDTHERETVAGVEIFETEELPTLMKEEETAATAMPGEETVVDMRRVTPAAPVRAPGERPPPKETTKIGVPTAAAPIEEYEMAAPTRAESGRISRSAKLRAMQVKRRAPHTVWTFLLFAAMVLILLNMPFVLNTMRNTAPPYARDLADTFRGLGGEFIMNMFCSQKAVKK
jgi:excisionase family DNA binding protein